MKSENDEEVDKIISKYNEIIKIINRYPGTKVTFLETSKTGINQKDTKTPMYLLNKMKTCQSKYTHLTAKSEK